MSDKQWKKKNHAGQELTEELERQRWFTLQTIASTVSPCCLPLLCPCWGPPPSSWLFVQKKELNQSTIVTYTMRIHCGKENHYTQKIKNWELDRKKKKNRATVINKQENQASEENK